MEKTINDKKDLLVEYLEKNGFVYSFDDDLTNAEVYSIKDSLHLSNVYVSINGAMILCKQVYLLSNIAVFKRKYQNENIESGMVAYSAIKWFGC